MSSQTPTLTAGRRRQPRTWGELIPLPARLQIAIISLLLVAVYRITLTDQVVYRWINDPNWSHGWLVPLFSIYFISTQRTKLAGITPRPSWVGLIALVAAMATYFSFMVVFRYAYPQAISFVIAVFAITLLLAGWRVARIVWFPIAFLVMAIPLPDFYYVKVTMPLRKLASEVAAVLLGMLPNLEVGTSGVTIDYFVRNTAHVGVLNVEEACSGMRLMMAFVTLGLAMAYLGQRPTWQRIVMVLCCIPIALICNIIRVTVTGIIHVYEIKSLASGTPHELLGLAMLPIALGLFALVGWVLRNLFVEEPQEEA